MEVVRCKSEKSFLHSAIKMNWSKQIVVLFAFLIAVCNAEENTGSTQSVLDGIIKINSENNILMSKFDSFCHCHCLSNPQKSFCFLGAVITVNTNRKNFHEMTEQNSVMSKVCTLTLSVRRISTFDMTRHGSAISLRFRSLIRLKEKSKPIYKESNIIFPRYVKQRFQVRPEHPYSV